MEICYAMIKTKIHIKLKFKHTTKWRPVWGREEEPLISLWLPSKNWCQENTRAPGQVRGDGGPGIPGAAGLGSRLQVSQLPSRVLSIHFVPCRGRRRDGRGKSTKNPTQVRPSLRARPAPHKSKPHQRKSCTRS